jgi:hypothetical protein
MARRQTLLLMACTASSSDCKNRERSFRVKSGLKPRLSPVSLKCRERSRIANDIPMLSSVNGFPVGPITRAPAVRHRDASGMSAVTAISPTPILSAIQSSATSAPSATTTRRARGLSGSLIQLFETKWTTSPWRSATRSASSFTGQASASTKSSKIAGTCHHALRAQRKRPSSRAASGGPAARTP